MTLKRTTCTNFRLLFIAGTLFLCNEAVVAEEKIQFNVVRDGKQERHISMIPEAGYTRDGRIRESYNPNSIVHQYDQMLRNLRQEYRELSMTSDSESAPEVERPEPISVRAKQAAAPAGNIFKNRSEKTDLEVLIELEKRAGRKKPTPHDQ